MGKILLLAIIIGVLAGLFIPRNTIGEIIWWFFKLGIKLIILLFFFVIGAMLTFMVIALWDV